MLFGCIYSENKNRTFIFGARVSFEKRIRGDFIKSGCEREEKKIFLNDRNSAFLHGRKTLLRRKGKENEISSSEKKDDENAHFFRSRHLNKDILENRYMFELRRGGLKRKKCFF